MEIKKAAQANLENERGTFLVLGLVFALSTLFVALEWSFDTEPSPEDFDLSVIYIESELTAPIVTPNIPAAVEATEVKPKKIETPPAIVHEDYKVVKEEPMELPEEVPVEAQPEEPPPAPPPRSGAAGATLHRAGCDANVSGRVERTESLFVSTHQISRLRSQRKTARARLVLVCCGKKRLRH